MAIAGFTGTRTLPFVRGELPRGPLWAPSLGFTVARELPLLRTTAARAVYQPDEYGRGSIRGTVKKKGDPLNMPLRRLVRCIRERDGKVVRETWSDELTGAYAFDQLVEAERYTVLAYDYVHDFRASVADNLEAVVA